jgi:hypothetical protein
MYDRFTFQSVNKTAMVKVLKNFQKGHVKPKSWSQEALPRNYTYKPSWSMAYPEGRLTPAMSANAAAQKELLHYLRSVS